MRAHRCGQWGGTDGPRDGLVAAESVGWQGPQGVSHVLRRGGGVQMRTPNCPLKSSYVCTIQPLRTDVFLDGSESVFVRLAVLISAAVAAKLSSAGLCSHNTAGSRWKRRAPPSSTAAILTGDTAWREFLAALTGSVAVELPSGSVGYDGPGQESGSRRVGAGQIHVLKCSFSKITKTAICVYFFPIQARSAAEQRPLLLRPKPLLQARHRLPIKVSCTSCHVSCCAIC